MSLSLVAPLPSASCCLGKPLSWEVTMQPMLGSCHAWRCEQGLCSWPSAPTLCSGLSQTAREQRSRAPAPGTAVSLHLPTLPSGEGGLLCTGGHLDGFQGQPQRAGKMGLEGKERQGGAGGSAGLQAGGHCPRDAHGDTQPVPHSLTSAPQQPSAPPRGDSQQGEGAGFNTGV